MKAARMHEYGKALLLEDVPVLTFSPMKFSFRSPRAECAAPTCSSCNGV
jgi:hypothetical protein